MATIKKNQEKSLISCNNEIKNAKWNRIKLSGDQSRFFKLKNKINELSHEAGSNPDPIEALRAKVKYNKLNKELEELILSQRIQNLPEELIEILKDFTI